MWIRFAPPVTLFINNKHKATNSNILEVFVINEQLFFNIPTCYGSLLAAIARPDKDR